MDIRVIGESIFNIESDCIVYFVDNNFANNDSLELIKYAGNRLLNTFSKISSIPTSQVKVVPAFDLKANYILLTVIPKNIQSKEDKEFLKEIFDNIIETFEMHEFNTMAIDIKRLNNSYGSEYCDELKKYLRSLDKDFVVFLCK